MKAKKLECFLPWWSSVGMVMVDVVAVTSEAMDSHREVLGMSLPSSVKESSDKSWWILLGQRHTQQY